MKDAPIPQKLVDRVGDVIQEKYKVLEKLGSGGMGTVYLAENILIGRKVAIKFLHKEKAENPASVARFQREARSATAIGNKHIVEVLDLGELDDGTAFMVLEYLEGRDLGAEIGDGQLSADKAAAVFVQICDALGAAHEKGIVHRDLKPENIYLIEREGNNDFVKVLDFGVAKIVSGEDEGHSLTRTGVAVGTYAYMSPEQAQALKNIDHRSDIFSLGVMLYQALTGFQPFGRTSQINILLTLCTSPHPPLTEHRDDLPEGLVAIVDKMLEKEPADRFENCGELKNALRPFVSGDIDLASSDEGVSISMEAKSPAQSSSGVSRESTPTAAAIPRAIAEAAASTDDGERASLLTAPPAPSPRNQRNLIIAILVGALLIAAPIVAILLGGLGSEEDEAAAGDVEGTVRVQIEVVPQGAQLFLDGDPIANPFDAELPRTRDSHQIEARLEGYQTLTREFSLLYPQTIRLELQSDGTGGE